MPRDARAVAKDSACRLQRTCAKPATEMPDLSFCRIVVWRRIAQGRREADRRPSDGKIKAARCGRPVLVACVCLHTGFLQPATALREVRKCCLDRKSKRDQGYSWLRAPRTFGAADRAQVRAMTVWRAAAGPRSPVKARDRLRRLEALTGLRRPGPLAAMRSWLHVSKIAPVSTAVEVAA
jgi:hypothetical protein